MVLETRVTTSTNQMPDLNINGVVIRVFPRFKQFACFHFEFSLANGDANRGNDFGLWF